MGSGAFLVETCRQLGDELIKAWYAHDLVPTDIPPDEDEVLYARRLIAQRCLYGVDKNDMAVDLAKLSLWLVTLAKDHPFTFLDHSLRHGDSLVGLTREQIIRFHWESKQRRLEGDLIQKRLDRATEARAKILNAREDVAYLDQAQRLALADESLNMIRTVGDACVSAFFAGTKKREREERCDQLYGVASAHLEILKNKGQIDFDLLRSLNKAAASLREGEHPIPPFHWEIEFPEVFARENGGFDGFVGNPPFIGGKRIKTMLGEPFRDWLIQVHAESNANSDIVAHFYRRAYSYLRDGGTFGLIATNTISQGDTRLTGLQWIRHHDGQIYNARKHVKWPGDAAVTVSVIHIAKGSVSESFSLDGGCVDKITAFLFHQGSDDNPKSLSANTNTAFIGCFLRGQGFTFDDTKSDSEASSLAEIDRLIELDERNRERIFPYIGGEEVNESSSHAHHRYVINFDSMSEDAARRWPHLMAHLEKTVKPSRDRLGKSNIDQTHKKFWWRFANDRPEMRNALDGLSRAIVISRVTQHVGFTFLSTDMVFSEQLVVFACDSFAFFSALQSRAHEIWARFFSSSLEDRLRYTPSDCFDSYPVPIADETLDAIGRTYFETRAHIMTASGLGLTKTYNRLHDPHEKSSEIAHLRELHEAMDRAVLEAYGWDDLAQTARCEFLLDYEEEEDDGSDPSTGGTKKSKKKKPWRLRWPDDFRDEVLARLLELNEQRHQEELLGGAPPDATKAKKKAKPLKSPQNKTLF